MKKRSAKNTKYLSLLSRDKQDLNRYNPNNSSQKKQVLHILEQVVRKEGQKMYFLLDVALQYTAANNHTQTHKEVVEEEEEESPLEADLDGVVSIVDREEGGISVRYTPLDEQLMQMASSYHSEAANHLYDGIASKFSYEDGYETTSPANDNAEEELTLTEEVIEKLENSKYDFSSVDIDHEEKEKIANWIKFNPGLFTLLEYLNNWNRDVDYNSAA